MNKVIVEINNLTFGYDKELIFRDFNLDIYESEYLGIIGPNGSGKSTLFKLILNLLKPLKGEIKLFKYPQYKYKDWSQIAFVPQITELSNNYFPATVKEVLLNSIIKQQNKLEKQLNFKEFKKQRLNQISDEFQLQNLQNKLISELSGGQKQRLNLARSLINKPQILFLDEPTLGVDKENQLNLHNLLLKLNKEQKLTIVIITHDLESLAMEADRIICINRYQDDPQKKQNQKIISKYFDQKITHLH